MNKVLKLAVKMLENTYFMGLGEVKVCNNISPTESMKRFYLPVEQAPHLRGGGSGVGKGKEQS